MKLVIAFLMLAAQPVFALNTTECVGQLNSSSVLSLSFEAGQLVQIALTDLDHSGIGEGAPQAVQAVGPAEYVITDLSGASMGLQVGTHLKLEAGRVHLFSLDGKSFQTYICK